jgi:hypothetical protein
MDGMNRRAFLQVTTGGAAAAVLPPLVALPTATGVPVLFDDRFPAARAHAEKLAGTEQSLQAMAGDATDLMQAFAAGRGPRRLIGVTARVRPLLPCGARAARQAPAPHPASTRPGSLRLAPASTRT